MNLLDSLIRNRGTGKEVRDYLDQQGWEGKYAQFDYLELFAIQRPGWVQVFKFSLRVSDPEGEWRRWLGVVRDDGRDSIQVSLVTSEVEQQQIAERLSQNLHTVRRQPSQRFKLHSALHWLALLLSVPYSRNRSPSQQAGPLQTRSPREMGAILAPAECITIWSAPYFTSQ